MKKAFDQTVRDLKREVNKKVLKVPSIEQKTLDATSNEPWGPHGSLLAEIAQDTRNYHDYQLIMAVLWKRTHGTGKNWRRVYKALNVLEYLVVHGSERVIDDIKEHAYQISALSDFLYTDSNGRDQGSNIRRKSQNILALINSKEKLREIRQKALMRDNRTSMPAVSSSGRYDEECFEVHDGNLNDGYRKERELANNFADTFHRGTKYAQGADPYGKNISERDKNNAFGNSDYSYKYSCNSVEENTDRFYDDDSHSTWSGGDREDGISHDERLFEHKVSSIHAPPSYEEATRDSLSNAWDDKNAGSVTASSPKVSSPSAPKKDFSKFASQNPYHNLNGISVPAHDKEVDSFEEFDPRGPESGSSFEDIFGLSTADSTDFADPMTVSSTGSEVNMLANSGLGANFVSVSTNSTVACKPDENPFGDAPFKAMPQKDSPSHPEKSHSSTSSHTSHAFVSNAKIISTEEAKMEESQNFKFEKEAEFFALQDPVAHSCDDILDGILPRTDQSHLLPKPGFSAYPASHAPQKSPQNSSAHTEFCQINPFEQLELSNHLTSALTCQSLQLDPSGPQNMLDAPDCSHTVKPNSLNAHSSQHQNMSVPLPSGAALGLTCLCQPESNNVPYIAQVNRTDVQWSSHPQPSQVTYADLRSGQSALTAEVQGSQMNTLYASANGTQVAHMNTVQQRGMLVSGSFQADQSILPANWRGAQVNPLQQDNLSASPVQAETIFSQTFHPETSHNMHSNPVNSLKQAVMTSPHSAAGVPASSNAFPSAVAFQSSVTYPSSLQTLSPVSIYSAQTYPSFSSQSASQNLRTSSPAVPSNIQAGQSTFTPQVVPSKTQPSKDKFETKSAVWADTLGRGLVNFNISGPKTNPLADIGIDFDAMNRKEKRNEVKSSRVPLTSTITMGKAMGTGSGLGRAGAGAVSPPFNPPMSAYGGLGVYGNGMSMGEAMGGGMSMGMGGHGGNMHQPSVGMGMTTRPPAGMPQQGHAMPGSYNPMNIGGACGQQQSYGGG